MKKVLLLCLLSLSIFSFSTQSQEKIIFNEDFSNNSRNWLEIKDTITLWKVENGKYYRENFQKKAYSSFKPVDLNIDNSFSISLTTTHLGGASDFAYGLIFGARDVNNRFGFVIAGTGQFKVYKAKEGVITSLVNWTTTSAIKMNSVLKKDDKKDNVLMIKKQGSDWKFYINDQFITSVPSEPFLGYGFGLSSEGIQSIAFDDLVVKESNASTPTVVKEDILFSDDFLLNTRNWPEGEDEFRKIKISNGKYSYERFKSGGSSSYPVYLNHRGDFSISVKTVHISGDEQNPFGICFGYLDADNLFEFDLYADGFYALYKIEKGKDTLLIKDAFSSVIKKGNNVLNDLKIKKEGSLWKFYVNESMIATHPALDFFGNRIGIVVYGKQKIEFDDLIVKQLNKVDAPSTVKTVANPVSEANTKINNSSNSKELVNEEFSNNNRNWQVFKNDSLDWQLKDGKYIQDNKSVSVKLTTLPVSLGQNNDYSISVSASQLGGDTKYGFGIVFGYRNPMDYYGFEISSAGFCTFYKFVRGKYTEIVKWTQSAAIKKNLPAQNILEIKKETTNWQFYINGQAVITQRIERMPGTDVGMIISGKQKIAFDNLVVKENSGTYTPPAAGRTRSRD